MTGLRYVTKAGQSVSGFPWSEDEVAARLAQDFNKQQAGQPVDAVASVWEPNGTAPGRLISGARLRRIIKKATNLHTEGSTI